MFGHNTQKGEEGDQSHSCDCATLAGWDRPLALRYLRRRFANSCHGSKAKTMLSAEENPSGLLLLVFVKKAVQF